MYIPHTDLMIRTSGEIRLSDFMLWQANDRCMIYFTNVLWPDFGFWHLFYAIMKYQFWKLKSNDVYGKELKKTI